MACLLWSTIVSRQSAQDIEGRGSAHLFVRREVEEQISLDEGLGLLVEKGYLFVRMCRDIKSFDLTLQSVRVYTTK